MFLTKKTLVFSNFLMAKGILFLLFFFEIFKKYVLEK